LPRGLGDHGGSQRCIRQRPTRRSHWPNACVTVKRLGQELMRPT
jgi:hypothetical protein